MKNKLIDKILDFCQNVLGGTDDNPFREDGYIVLRNRQNKKWFGLIFCCEKQKLGLDGDEKIDIINLKQKPTDIPFLIQQNGVFPAYHMNKTHWISVALDEKVDINFLKDLLEQSYNLVAPKIKAKN